MQSALILSRLALDPGPMLIMQPRDADIRDYSVELDTLAEQSLKHNSLAVDKARRDVQQIRRLPTGNVNFSAAGSPANFRRIGARYLWMDEISAYEPTAEGPPVAWRSSEPTAIPTVGYGRRALPARLKRATCRSYMTNPINGYLKSRASSVAPSKNCTGRISGGSRNGRIRQKWNVSIARLEFQKLGNERW